MRSEWQELYDLNAAYDNEAGYYNSNDELGLKTLSRFIRLMNLECKTKPVTEISREQKKRK